MTQTVPWPASGTNGSEQHLLAAGDAGRGIGDVVRDLAVAHDILVIPGTAFLPDDRAMFRISVSNIGRAGIDDFAQRLAAAGQDSRTLNR